jgi:pimeloyl-ACP methyl ester carboxylesterase
MVITAVDETHLETRRATLPSGVTLNYVQRGAVEGPAVVMLHGISDSSFSFSRVMPLMPAHLRAIAVDLRGHGDSDRPAADYSMTAFADDVLALMDTLGIRSATLVGHSMGTFIARRAAEIAPARITRLVLVGSALTARNWVIEDLLTSTESFTDPVDEGFIWDFQASTIRKPVPPEFFLRVVAESRKLPARVWRASVAGMWAFNPQRPIDCPTTILGGDRDTVFSVDEQVELFLSTKQATLHIETGVGHTLHWEAAERFVELAFTDI